MFDKTLIPGMSKKSLQAILYIFLYILKAWLSLENFVCILIEYSIKESEVKNTKSSSRQITFFISRENQRLIEIPIVLNFSDKVTPRFV